MNKGMSMIEMLVVLVIMSMTILAGAVYFQGLEPKYRLRTATWEVSSRLTQARFRAFLDGAPVRLKFVLNHYNLEEWDEELKSWRIKDRAILQGVSLVSNNNPVFYPEGTVSNLATIIVSNSRGSYKITLAITGRVKVTRL